MRPAASSAVARMAASSRSVLTSTVISSDTVRPFSWPFAGARPPGRRLAETLPRPRMLSRSFLSCCYSPKMASIFALSVAALNGLTM
jgi:hypothetical protein